MSEDVTANGLLVVRHEDLQRSYHLRTDEITYHRGTGISRHLIRDKDGNVELFGQLHETRDENVELLLTISELTATRIINTERGNDRINDQELVATFFGHTSSDISRVFDQVLRRKGTSDENVFKSQVGIPRS